MDKLIFFIKLIFSKFYLIMIQANIILNFFDLNNHNSFNIYYFYIYKLIIIIKLSKKIYLKYK